MRRIIAFMLMGCTALLASTALGQAPTAQTEKQEKRTVAKGEEYHHLLMLDVREAADHAKALHDYARRHANHLDKSVVTKHFDELKKNIDGVQTELTNIEQNMDPKHKESVQAHLTRISSEEQTARQNLDALAQAITAEKLDAKVIEEKSMGIYEAMSSAREHHRQAMKKTGAHEPAEPVVKR